MAAPSFEVVGAGCEGGVRVEGADRTHTSVALLTVEGHDGRRNSQCVRQARRHDADNSAVPAIVGNDDPALGRFAVDLHRLGQGLLRRLLSQGSPCLVGPLNLFRKGPRLGRIPSLQEPQGEVGIAEPPRCIEPRR